MVSISITSGEFNSCGDHPRSNGQNSDGKKSTISITRRVAKPKLAICRGFPRRLHFKDFFADIFADILSDCSTFEIDQWEESDR